MASFQKSVLIIAVVLLIIALILFLVLMVQSSKNYPPLVANCPDYWIDLSGGVSSDGSACYNVKNLGKSQCKKQMDFTDDFWTGDNEGCNKQNWAKACDLTWDGITNNQNACIVDDDNSGGSSSTSCNKDSYFSKTQDSLKGFMDKF
jgi:hypothetical protein